MSIPYTDQLIRIGQIAGMHYRAAWPSKNLVSYGIGAPIPPDSRSLPDAPVVMEFSVDFFVPDYLDYARSDGLITPLGSIQTFVWLYQRFLAGCHAVNPYERREAYLHYERIMLVGRNFGWTYVPLAPRFDSRIRELATFCLVVDSKSCGSVEGEESNADFLRSMRLDGYHHLYRGILAPEWVDHLENRDNLSPMDNVEHLAEARLFIAHGRRDHTVHHAKSVTFHERLIARFPHRQEDFLLQLYDDGDHGLSTTNPAARDFLQWLGVNERQSADRCGTRW